LIQGFSFLTNLKLTSTAEQPEERRAGWELLLLAERCRGFRSLGFGQADAGGGAD